MKYVLGIVSIIIGLISNFLVFTPMGDQILTKYSVNLLYNIGLAIIGLIAGIVAIVKSKEKVLSSIGIIINVIFLGYTLMLVSFVS